MNCASESSAYIIEPLRMGHDRLAFSCGIEALDTYLHRQAGQDARRRVTAPFVLVYGSNPTVIGYYTLSQMRIHLGDLPPNIVKKLPKYPAIPVTLLGRLAVNGRYRGLGLGEFLLLDALWRSWTLSSEIAAFAVVVDAKDDSSIAFYEHYEFQAFPEHPQRLFITMAKLEKLFTR